MYLSSSIDFVKQKIEEKFSASIKYENVYSDSGKSAIQISEDWFNEIKESL